MAGRKRKATASARKPNKPESTLKLQKVTSTGWKRNLPASTQDEDSIGVITIDTGSEDESVEVQSQARTGRMGTRTRASVKKEREDAAAPATKKVPVSDKQELVITVDTESVDEQPAVKRTRTRSRRTPVQKKVEESRLGPQPAKASELPTSPGVLEDETLEVAAQVRTRRMSTRASIKKGRDASVAKDFPVSVKKRGNASPGKDFPVSAKKRGSASATKEDNIPPVSATQNYGRLIATEAVVRLVQLTIDEIRAHQALPTCEVQEEERKESRLGQSTSQIEISADSELVDQEPEPPITTHPIPVSGPIDFQAPLEGPTTVQVEDRKESKFCSIAEVDIDDEGKLEIMEAVMGSDQMQRFQCYLHSGLNFSTVRSVMQGISMNAVDDVCVWAVCDLVKLYVEDITNAALDYEENCGESGPISPEAIIAASFKLKLEQREHEESTTR